MGRSTTTTSAGQQAANKPWSTVYTERPIWGIFAMNSSGATAWVYAFGASNRMMSVGTDRLDTTNNGNRAGGHTTGSGSETATSYYVTGNSGTQVTSQAWSPASGYYGINSNSQTALLNNAYAFQNGNIGYMNTSNQPFVQRWAATQIMYEYQQQDYDIVGSSTAYRIQCAQVEAVQQDLDYTYTHGVLNTGSLFDTTNHVGGVHIMSYNRRTNTMAFLFHCADNATGTKRLHLFKMLPTFNPNAFTTGASIVTALADAKANGGYSTYLINLPSWHNTNTGAGRNGGKLVLCDDNSLWFVSEQPNNGSTGAILLYSLVFNGSGYTATQVKSMATTTHYNSDAGDQYALHHQNSDDNKYIAIYCHYYYYLGGYNLYVVSTATAAATGGVYDYAWYSDGGSYSVTIAPSGGSEFVTCDGYQNSDGGAGPYIRFHSPSQRHATNNTMLRRALPAGIYPAYSCSTNYQGNFVFKFQPVNQYK